MPNPNFTGTVPHRRCETCKLWLRIGNSGAAAGHCSLAANASSLYGPLVTLDLSVCSNWTGKEE